MLGDTGANVLGAGAGLGRGRHDQPGAWWVAVVVLAALNVASESGQLQRGDRPDPAPALARPPRRPTALERCSHQPDRCGRARRPQVLLAPSIHGGRERSR